MERRADLLQIREEGRESKGCVRKKKNHKLPADDGVQTRRL